MSDASWILSVENRISELYGNVEAIKQILEADFGKNINEILEDIRNGEFQREEEEEIEEEKGEENGRKNVKPKPQKE